ncbi:cytochrome P450 [Annulohypoxylon truncatum]|uniref:cytochrome P450 n=1 Tax=Annulohypoxylon truncatum TaxID=327061 RepID=UPI002007F2AE|nr:cytochrome P450 [Annulohypoxylon truncatum]KAI1204973.1 cytochrome P450 [Annulohypoxylon truncatum]
MPSAFALSIVAIAITFAPKAVTGNIPSLSTIYGMFVHKDDYYIRLGNETQLPIYTLKLPGLSLYVINSLHLIQRIDRHITTVDFAPLQAQMCKKAINSCLRSFPRTAAPGAMPGPGLNALGKVVVKTFTDTFDRMESQGGIAVDLFDWVNRETLCASTNALYGPHNPFRDPEVEKEWFDYASGLLTIFMGIFPNILARRGVEGRETMVSALMKYFQKGRHLEGSMFIQLGQKYNESFGFTLADRARVEVGQVAAAIFNTAPGAFWAVWQALADPVVFEDCRQEVTQLVRNDADGTSTIDLARIRAEFFRFHGTSIAFRLVQEDTLIDNQYLLQKGGAALMPNAVVYCDESARNESAKHPATAFRGFGGGHVLCPGRHFAISGKWSEPKKDLVVGKALPIPKSRLNVKFVSKPGRKWRTIHLAKDATDISSKDT